MAAQKIFVDALAAGQRNKADVEFKCHSAWYAIFGRDFGEWLAASERRDTMFITEALAGMLCC